MGDNKPLNDFAPVVKSEAADEVGNLINTISSVFLQDGGHGKYVSAQLRDTTLESLNTHIAAVYFGMNVDKLSWFNKLVLPVIISKEIVHVMTKRQVESSSLDVVGPFGVSRRNGMMETKQVSKSKRFGHHVFMENDFADSKKGQDDLVRFLQQFSDLAVKQCVMTGYVALFQKETIISQDRLNNSYLREQDEEQYIINFALSHKQETGFCQLVHHHKKIMENEFGVIPDIAIVPRGKLEFLFKFGNNKFNSYDKAGPNGPKLLNSSTPFTEIQGVKVFDAPFDNALNHGETTAEVSTQSVERLTGEFFPLFNYAGMPAPPFDLKALAERADYAAKKSGKATKEANDIATNANASDDEKSLAKATAEKATTDALEALKEANEAAVALPVKDERCWMVFDSFTNALTELTPAVLNKYARLIRVEDLDLDGNIKKNRNNPVLYTDPEYMTNMVYILFKPLHAVRASTVVMVKGGRETGCVYQSPESITMGIDNTHQTFSFEYRAYYGNEVNYDNVALIPNAFYDGTVRGGNTKLLTVKEATELGTKPDTFSLANENSPGCYVMAFNDDEYLEKSLFTRKISLANDSDFMTDMKNKLKDPKDTFSIRFMRYYRAFGWDKIPSQDQDGPEISKQIAREVYHGALKYYTSSGLQEKTGCGHHGLYAEPGCRETRRGGIRMNPRL